MFARAAVFASAASGLAVLGTPGVAPAATFAGDPAGSQVTVFHPFNDLRRPVAVTQRAPGAQGGRSFHLAPAGTSDVRVVGNARGDAVAWWNAREHQMVAVRDRGKR